MYYDMSMATLNANSNVLELTHSEIDNTCSFEIYVDDSSDVIPQKLSVSGHTLSVIFDSKPSYNVECRVLIIKGLGILDGDKVEYSSGTSVNDQLYSISVDLTDIYTNLRNLTTTVDERVPSQTVLGGVLYHSTTGNTWKKLDAQNLDYDEQSTIYSAMGNIDELETTSKNLVGAINEVKAESGIEILHKHVVATTSSSGNISATSINLSSSDYIILGITGLASNLYFICHNVSEPYLYYIHIKNRENLTPVINTAIECDVYYIHK